MLRASQQQKTKLVSLRENSKLTGLLPKEGEGATARP